MRKAKDSRAERAENCMEVKSLTGQKLAKLHKKLRDIAENGILDEMINELVGDALTIEDTERAIELFLAARLLYVVKSVMIEEGNNII